MAGKLNSSVVLTAIPRPSLIWWWVVGRPVHAFRVQGDSDIGTEAMAITRFPTEIDRVHDIVVTHRRPKEPTVSP